MMTRSLITLLSSAALFGTACAAEKSEGATPTESQAADVQAAEVLAAATPQTPAFSAPDEAWRDVDLENTIYVDTNHGRIVVELYPEVSPKHVEQIKTLTRNKFYDYITFHRVIEGFMNQTGDPKGDGTGDSDLPNIEAEFTFRRSPDMGVTLIGSRNIDMGGGRKAELGVGYYKGLPVASMPSAQAMLTKDGKVTAFGLHCKGVTSMARGQDTNSANSQFFLMRGKAEHLDANYTVWGNTVWGHDNLTKIKVGSVGEVDGFVPDKMEKVRVAADLPAEEQLAVQVLDTSSPAFTKYLRTFKKDDGTYPHICDIEVPTRLKP